MKITRLALAALLTAFVTPAIAQEAAPVAAPAPAVPTPPAPPPAPKPVMVTVKMLTSEGAIMLELEKQRAPITTANFLKYVDGKRFDNIGFYRAVPVPNDATMGLIQGGVQYDPKKSFPMIAHEPTSKTGVTHEDGTISMARNAPGTAAGDFFIIVGKMDYMNATATDPGYAAFGHVVEGMDVVRKILAAPRSPTLGKGIMKGQMLSPTVKIISVRRVPAAK